MRIRELIALLLSYDDLDKEVFIVNDNGYELPIKQLEQDVSTKEVYIVSEDE